LILLLFTSSYPYDFAAEYTFIQPEIPYLLGRFERVILVPRMCKGNRLSLPTAVEVNGDYADFLQQGSKPQEMLEMAFSSKCFFQELRTHPAVLLYPAKILKLILFSGRAELTKRWVTNLIKSQQFDPDQCLLYSYWFDHTATGLARIKKEFPRMKLVSRAHGYDLYEEYYYPYYWPYRPETLQALDVLFFASDAGRSYYRDQYSEFTSKYETAHLGTKDPGFVSRPSEDGVFRVVSCANIVPVKRVGLLLDGIAAAARMRPQQAFEWIHFGDGKDRKALDRRMSRDFPPNARGRLLGNVPNPEIMQHYKENPVDVFLNVSSTEGGAPVAIQEAISCGIPVVATAVGGNSEVVSEKNGILLNSNPKPREIAAALLKIWDDPQQAARMKQESRQVWQRNYDAEVNFRLFADRLRTMGAR
jgi:colanic acid/amylovoran biosynthesis glycosyltransferase